MCASKCISVVTIAVKQSRCVLYLRNIPHNITKWRAFWTLLTSKHATEHYCKSVSSTYLTISSFPCRRFACGFLIKMLYVSSVSPHLTYTPLTHLLSNHKSRGRGGTLQQGHIALSLLCELGVRAVKQVSHCFWQHIVKTCLCCVLSFYESFPRLTYSQKIVIVLFNVEELINILHSKKLYLFAEMCVHCGSTSNWHLFLVHLACYLHKTIGLMYRSRLEHVLWLAQHLLLSNPLPYFKSFQNDLNVSMI
jgi:hypothetical protein